MKKLICVIGASGAIGKRLLSHIKNNLKNYDVEGTYFEKKDNNLFQLDMHNHSALESYIRLRQPFLIIWLSGSKNVTKCEIDKEYAYKMNCTPIQSLIEILTIYSPTTKIMYMSSDYVFKGNAGYYKEDDVCEPNSYYGKSKLKSEKLLTKSKLDYIIIRTSAVMIKGEGFLNWLKSQLECSSETKLFSNTFFSPTPINSLNSAIQSLINMKFWDKRVIHFAGPRISRYNFGLKITDHFGINNNLLVSEIADFENTTFQKDISLVTSKELEEITTDIWPQLFKEFAND